jgi:hypothetical protein
MIRINDFKVKTTLKAAVLASLFVLLAAAPGFSQQVVNLTAGPATAALPDGTVVPMWGYACGAAVTGATATCAPLSGPVSGAALGALGGIYVINGGSGYTTAPAVTISAPTGTIAGVTNVTATATAVVSGGAVVGFNITGHGAGYVTAPTVTFAGGSGSGAVAAAAPAWSPVQITVPFGATGGLQINLTNNLSFTPATGGAANNVPTSIVIMGQVGAGLGALSTSTPSPDHTDAQGCVTWFIASGATPPGTPCTSPQAGASGQPPIQGPRVQSMSTEVPAGAPGAAASTSLLWANLKPGTYLLESGTHPSIQVPMGLIGMLVVTTAPVPAGSTAAVPGTAYPAVAATTKTAAIPAVTYNAEVPLEFSEIDPVQNKEVDQAVRTAGFSETAVWTRMNTGSITSLTLSTPGSGYTSAPAVSFSGGCATSATCGGAAATATLGYGVASPLTITSGGSGYTTAPTVSFVGGSGEGATATATLSATQGVASAIVASGGTGYAVGDVLTLGGGTGTAATVTVSAVSGGVITGVTLTSAGSYSVVPTNPVSVTDATTPAASGATLTATLGFSVASIAVTNGGAYTSAPTVQILDGGGTGAAATATLSTTSTLAVTLTSGGGGYTSAPNVMISGGGATTNATATATVASGGCGDAHTCYPPAVNYTPFYFVINGLAFDKTNAPASLFAATAGVSGTPPVPVTTAIPATGTVLVRMVNAGLRMHVPSIVGSQTAGFTGAGAAATVAGFTLIAEDGNTVPNLAITTGTVTSTAPRVQTDVFMAAGKTFDVMVNVPAMATGATVPPSLPVYDRELSLSANSSVRDAGMLAYISVNGALLPASTGAGATGVFAAAKANSDTYNSVIPCASTATSCAPLVVSDVSKGVIANDINVNGVALSSPPTLGALTCNALAGSPVAGICANGTFTYTPNPGTTADSFGYCANGAAAGNANLCTTVTLGAATLGGPPVANATTYISKMATFLKIPSPGVLSVDSDPSNLPLQVTALSFPGTTSCVNCSGLTVSVDPNGGFIASIATNSATATVPATATFTYTAQNSQGTKSSAATVTLVFPKPSNLKVNVLDAQAYNNCQGNSACIATLVPFSDYRWIIEEDKTFWVDPNCTTNSSITTPGCVAVVGGAGTTGSTIPTFGVNFHASNMGFVAQGCTGPLSCEGGQTWLNPATGTHDPAVCDVGNGACRLDSTGNGFTAVNPSQVALDPAKRYYISVLPGDAGNPFPAYLGQPVCNGAEAPALTPGTSGNCGHTMSGAPIPPACNILGGTNACATTSAFTKPVNVLVLPTPLPTGRLSVIVFEDDFPLNGEQDGGGGNGTVPPIEPGLGGFNLVLWDTYGGLGDVTGQDTYDMFNQPLSNSLAGTVDPVTGEDACPVSATPLSGPAGAGPAPLPGGITGMIVTCPKYEADGTTLSPLAGQAVIANLMPEKFSVQAYPAADRIARGEQWVQTNTLDGQHAHDSFIRIGEPSYFQEYGPAGYHVSIGFANPAIINARAKDVCAGAGTPGSVGPCTNMITGQIDVQRASRTPDQRLYPSGSRDALGWTQCWVSLGDPDGEDFQFTFCDANGNFKFTNVPGGNWRLTVGDQWNDQIIDGLSIPANVGCTSTAPNGTNNATTCPGGQTLALGNIGTQQWQANLYTRTFIDDNKDGIWESNEIGIPFNYTMIHYRDGHNSNAQVTDFNGIANFNETFPLFNWYTVEADSTRYKTTGIHTVYDAGGPADGSPSCGTGARPCGTSTAYNFLSNTSESVPLPADLSVPGAVYCKTADCSAEAATFALGNAIPSFSTASTGRIDPPTATGTEGFAGLTGMSNWVEIGKAPYASCPPACVSVPNAVSNPAGGTTASTTPVGENGGIQGKVVYASTRPFDDASQMIQQPWAPNIPNVTLNLYQEGFAADGVTPTRTLVDTTQTSSWDDWAQGFYPNSTVTGGTLKPYMNCPGQGTDAAGAANQDPFFYTLFDQPNYLDWYNSAYNGGTLHPLPYNSQYKCYDSMHMGNQLQPAPYDGKYSFPSVLGINPTTGKLNTALTGGVGGNGAGTTGFKAGSMAGTNCTVCVANPDTTDKWRVGTPMLPPGKYVVEVIMPPGYEVYKEEDKNLLIGDNYIAPVTQQFGGLGADVFIIPDQASVASMYDPTTSGYNPNNFQNQTTGLGLADEVTGVPGFPGFVDPLWPCVGEMRVVPDYLSLFPHAQEVAPFAGATRPLCDHKEVTLQNQMSVSAKFYIYTSTHIASKFTGGITDDFTSEFDPFSPQFGEKFAPPNMPISTKDYLGNEIARVYSDHWGTYEGLNYSSWEVNPPNITGYSPTMMVQCMNDPGPILDTTVGSPTYGQMITDPLYNPAYSNFCYTNPYMPGLTTYLDTPVVPTTAFVGAGYNNVDCAYPDTTPAIKEVDGDQIGPWVSAAGKTLTITALGNQQVNNSAYSGPSANAAPFNLKTVNRHYGFGPTGTVTIGGVRATIGSWSDTSITVTVPSGVPNCEIQQQAQYGGSAAQCGQLVITSGNGKQSIDTVTVTIGGKGPKHIPASATIQSYIDTAAPGDLLIVDPTCMTVATPTTPAAIAACSASALHAATPTQTASVGSHNELLIMWKPVRLQGVGAVSSIINASAFPAGKLLDPWRRHINCLFDLNLQGVPVGQPVPSATNPAVTTPATYDPTGIGYSCPDAGWTYFGTDLTGTGGGTVVANAPQIDRLPLEATVGWDATQNGNIAEQLQEPSLMGAFEGAGITVLAKGVDYHGANPWSDGNEGGAFPPTTTLLTGVGPVPSALIAGDANPYCHTLASTGTSSTSNTIVSQTNPFPSNFMCNPSSIDGLTVTSSSQGGGGIFAHGWAHHLQVANNRVYNNAGTLTGGIGIGQGEFPTPYVQGGTTNAAPGSCSDGTGYIANQHLPYCLQIDVNVHNNYVTTNSSLGDELFSGTLSGGGGATFCTGNDYYRFNYNWVCGNLSAGEGGGLVHLGEIQNGDIEHNSFVLNQSQNPTIPTNGGAIMVQGTPDTDPICGVQLDADCPPGLSDGIGHNLVINANLIQGNSSESGSGGGIRLQQVNGTDVSTFPFFNTISAATEAPVVTIRIAGGRANVLPRVGDSVTIAGVSVAGYNGTFTVTHVGGGGGGGRTFQYIGTTPGLGTGTGGTFTDATTITAGGSITSATDTAPGTVTITSTLNPTVGDSVTISGFTGAFTIYNGTHTVTGVPATGSFTYTGQTGTYTAFTATTAPFPTVTDANPNQLVTNLWNSVFITNNIIVNNTAGWDGAGISLQDALNVSIVNNTIAHNDSLASSGVLTQSIGTPLASAPAGSCTANGFTTSCPQSAGVTSTPNSSLLTTTFTGLTIECPFGEPETGNGSCLAISNPLLMNNLINQNRSFRVAVGTLGTGTLNQQNLITLSPQLTQTSTGSCAAGASYLDMGVRGGGFSITTAGKNNTISDANQEFVSQYCDGSRVPPECSVADGCGGPSGYGVPPGIVDATTPNPVFMLNPSATVDEGNNWINVSWGPLALADPSIQGPTVGGVAGNYGGGLALGNYALLQSSPLIDSITVNATNLPTATIPQLVTDFFGNPRPDAANRNRFDVGAVEYQHNGSNLTATLTGISPNSGLRGATVTVTLTGTNLTSASAVNVSGTGITVTGVGVQSATTVVATFTISATATTGARNVSVVTSLGTTGNVTFTVTAATPTLTSISPSSGERGAAVPVTLTGTNLAGATWRAGIGTTYPNITFGALTVNAAGTSATATLTLASATTLGVKNLSVTTANGTSNTVAFTVTGATLTISAPAPAMNSGGTTTKNGIITVRNTAAGANAGAFTFTAAPTIAKTGGAGNGAFSITGGTCVSGFVVNAGGSCTVNVQYAGETNTSTATGHVTVTGNGLAAATQTGANFNAN